MTGNPLRFPASRRFVIGAAAAAATLGRLPTALEPRPADPYAGGRISLGRGTVSTLLDVTDPEFGASGDAVLLNDLVVTGGSRSISSATAPFVSTEHDRGKLVYWRTVDGSVGRGAIASVQSTSQALLVEAASRTSRADGGPNMNGAVGTDNTKALDAAFAAAQAAAQTVAPDRRVDVTRVQVHIPRGVFLIRRLADVQQSGVMVTGEGRFSSLIASGEDGAWISLSTYSSSPPTAFPGTATDWTFQDLHFVNPCGGSGSSEGQRHGRAVQDNGSGGTRLLGCGFTGLEYGFCGAYGSDFSQIRDSYFYQCDTGYYFGPGSQQIDIAKTDAAQCREGAVFEGAPDWHLGNASSFEDPSVAAVTLEAKGSGSTRMGLPVNVPGASYSGKFLIDGATWFETNSGGNGRTAPRMIWMHGDGPFGGPSEGLIVRDAYFIAGGNQVQGGTNCFVEYASALNSAEPVVIEDLVVGGTFINSVFRMSGSASSSSPRIVAPAVDRSIALLQGPTGGAKVLNRDGSAIWAVDVTAPTARTTAVRVRVRDDDGAVPLLAAQRAASNDPVSGIGARGALLDASVRSQPQGGTVVVDAAAANHQSIDGGDPITGMAIKNAPRSTGQLLSIEVEAPGGDRPVRWPDDCRFAGGQPPSAVTSGTSTTVTFRWQPATRRWREIARSVAVPL